MARGVVLEYNPMHVSEEGVLKPLLKLVALHLASLPIEHSKVAYRQHRGSRDEKLNKAALHDS